MDAPASEPLLFIARRVGLANRLRALVGYDALARLTGRPFALCWVRDAACEATFGELFDPAAFTLIDEAAFAEQRARDGVRVFGEPIWFHDIWRRHLPDVPWLTFLHAVRVSLDALRPAPRIAQAAAQFAAAHRLSEAVGLHVRYTDNVDVEQLRARFDAGFDAASSSTLDGFRAVIRAQLPQGPVLLATDNAAIERTFQAECGGALITYPKTYSQEWVSQGQLTDIPEEQPVRMTPVADALIELLLLRACRMVVGTYYSSFSELAGLWSGRDYCEVRGATTARNRMVDTTSADLDLLATTTS